MKDKKQTNQQAVEDTARARRHEMTHKKLKKCPGCHNPTAETGSAFECVACLGRGAVGAAEKFRTRKCAEMEALPGVSKEIFISSRQGFWVNPKLISGVLIKLYGDAEGMPDGEKEECLVAGLANRCRVSKDVVNIIRLSRIVRAHMQIKGEKNEQ